ncbi:MAG TPA: hypothetical protein VFA93_00900, partial [Patescibacteria group bacterium]|nr:hypothetical protein [Patescibacteria group bacterium]
VVGEVYKKTDLHKLISSKQGKVVWGIDKRTLASYCEQLSSVGFMQTALDPETFRKTEKGGQLGDTVAGHFLDLSEKYGGISLWNIFGNANSPTKDNEPTIAPINRYRIYKFLVENANGVVQAELIRELANKNLDVHLESLSNKGIVTTRRWNGLRMIWLSQKQKSVVSEVVDIVDKISTGDQQFLIAGRKKAQEITGDPKRVARLLTKARETSPGANRIQSEELAETIEATLRLHPSLTNAQLRDYLSLDLARTLSKERIAQLTRMLRTEGRIRIAGKDRAFHYSSR